MKLAILGGSFNPIHLGHLNLAEAVYKEFAYDKIAIIPAYISPFKFFCKNSEIDDRLKMIKMAILDKPYIYSELYEIEKKGVSYTIDTINYLYRKFPDIEGKIGLIIGDDLKDSFSLWKDADEIIRKTDIIIGKRIKLELSKETKNNSHSVKKYFPFKELKNKVLNISSTQIREAVLRKENFSSFVSKEVYDYIIKNALYEKNQNNNMMNNTSKMSTADIELKTREIDSYAKKNLNDSRYAHSVRVADYAGLLAKEYKEENVSFELAYFTGLAHDICKDCTDEELLNIVKADELGIDDIEKKRLNLLHGRAAAIILQKDFGIQSESILKAVAFHTFGYEGIDSLGKIIYIADKIEPGRPNTENFRNMVKSISLNNLMLAVLDWNLDYIEKKGLIIHSATKKMYEQIQKELKIESQVYGYR